MYKVGNHLISSGMYWRVIAIRKTYHGIVALHRKNPGKSWTCTAGGQWLLLEYVPECVPKFQTRDD